MQLTCLCIFSLAAEWLKHDTDVSLQMQLLSLEKTENPYAILAATLCADTTLLRRYLQKHPEQVFNSLRLYMLLSPITSHVPITSTPSLSNGSHSLSCSRTLFTHCQCLNRVTQLARTHEYRYVVQFTHYNIVLQDFN